MLSHGMLMVNSYKVKRESGFERILFYLKS